MPLPNALAHWIEYARFNLGEGEQILFQTGKHWIILVWPFIVYTTIIATAIWASDPAFWHALSRAQPPEILQAIITYPASAIALFAVVVSPYYALIFFLRFIQWLTTEVTVTNERVIWKWGFYFRVTDQLGLRAFERVQMEQSILGRAIAVIGAAPYSDIVISGFSGRSPTMRSISNPIKLNQIAQQANKDFQGR